ncbi:MAG: hypothetical protein L0J17_08380 [Brevibacterium sp.]|uniref:hypothetical protein n=1 Tax=Brevibacterium sp. TaxID=1701 RepID=UPI002647D353|nr:hypothetical protein [Brevibacterium sp.]MDN5910250.1 hypothetical protein [Brevibacterium sp.]MDN6133538.1 hypothetical protein [Brevibacterium sp.]MDN6158297.1 hypothetical protein [Brevibacterium sp.]MDN6175393.1 hypothetical protein [Brevibacterium sp.]MDN6527989.1 hypothetical protein [Brevibacterium sp.]
MFRIFPSVPITWRSSSCVQFGVDDPVLIDGLLPADVALVDELRMGVGSAQYYSRAQDLGADLGRASSLITLLDEAGVMVPDDSDAATVTKSSPLLATAQIFALSPDRVAKLLGDSPIMVAGPLRAVTEQYLSASGFAIAAEHRVEDLDLMSSPLVVTTSYLVPDLHTATWLTDREVPHCQVVIGEYSLEVTGLIRPGTTPCAICACLAKKDADDSWLDQHSHIRALPDRESLSDPLSRALGAINVVQILRRALLSPGTEPVLRNVSLATGIGTDEALAFHPRCQCRVPVPHFDLIAEQVQ